MAAIRDVQGHSLHAATVMGELRAFAGEGHRPPAIASLVNKVLQRQRQAALDPRRESLDAFTDRILALSGAREDDVALIALRRPRRTKVGPVVRSAPVPRLVAGRDY